MTNTVVNLIGTGVWDSGTSQALINATFIINTSNPTGYTIGSSTRNLLGLNNSTVTLIGSSVVNVSTGHSMTISNSVTLSTNNTGSGGSQILWQNLNTSITTTLTLTNDTTFNGNVSIGGNSALIINTGKFLIGGNLNGNTNLAAFGGTSTIELFGPNSCTWGGQPGANYQNNITINKSGGAIVTLSSNINYGLANRTLNINTAINPLTNTFFLKGTPLTITNSANTAFWNLTTESGAQTINLN
jgi:hypothetical protein